MKSIAAILFFSYCLAPTQVQAVEEVKSVFWEVFPDSPDALKAARSVGPRSSSERLSSQPIIKAGPKRNIREAAAPAAPCEITVGAEDAKRALRRASELKWTPMNFFTDPALGADQSCNYSLSAEVLQVVHDCCHMNLITPIAVKTSGKNGADIRMARMKMGHGLILVGYPVQNSFSYNYLASGSTYTMTLTPSVKLGVAGPGVLDPIQGVRVKWTEKNLIKGLLVQGCNPKIKSVTQREGKIVIVGEGCWSEGQKEIGPAALIEYQEPKDAQPVKSLARQVVDATRRRILDLLPEDLAALRFD